MTIMIGRLSDPRSSQTVHLALIAQMRSAIVVSGSVDVRGFTVNKDTAVSEDEPVLNTLASLVGSLAFVPGGRTGSEITCS